jgi:Ser/Thr protein kinase RdoA (MazF antagonist)
MTKSAGFKRVVRRHAAETGQRYTEAKMDLEGLEARMHHVPAGDALLTHLRDYYGVDAIKATRLSVNNTYVFRIDRSDGEPWVARQYPPARPRAGAEGDAAILRFLQAQGYPAERLAVEDAVSEFEGSAVLVTQFVEGRPMPGHLGPEEFTILGDLLGRLHALPPDDAIARPGGAQGLDPAREGAPRQDLQAGLAFLDAVDTKVAASDRPRFEQLRRRVRMADDGQGLPDGLLHGNLLHAQSHAVLSDSGAIAINWMSSGRGPRLADLAWLLWGTGSWGPRRANRECVSAAVAAYRQHIEPTEEELDRLEPVMYIRPLYLVCFGYRRALASGRAFEDFGFIEPSQYFAETAAAAVEGFRR